MRDSAERTPDGQGPRAGGRRAGASGWRIRAGHANARRDRGWRALAWGIVFAASTAVWLLSMGPGLYRPAPSDPPLLTTSKDPASVAAQPMHWNYVLFSSVCHARPERSYFLRGRQMAVNSRCTGFFTGLWGGLLLLPLLWHRIYGKKWVLFALIVCVFLQAGDVAGNVTGAWVNTLGSRFWLGLPLGFFLAMTLSDAFAAGRSTPEMRTQASP